jgi:hypothetical protein
MVEEKNTVKKGSENLYGRIKKKIHHTSIQSLTNPKVMSRKNRETREKETARTDHPKSIEDGPFPNPKETATCPCRKLPNF